MAATTPEPKARSVAERLRALAAWQPKKGLVPLGTLSLAQMDELLSIAEAVEREAKQLRSGEMCYCGDGHYHAICKRDAAIADALAPEEK